MGSNMDICKAWTCGDKTNYGIWACRARKDDGKSLSSKAGKWATITLVALGIIVGVASLLSHLGIIQLGAGGVLMGSATAFYATIIGFGVGVVTLALYVGLHCIRGHKTSEPMPDLEKPTVGEKKSEHTSNDSNLSDPA